MNFGGHNSTPNKCSCTYLFYSLYGFYLNYIQEKSAMMVSVLSASKELLLSPWTHQAKKGEDRWWGPNREAGGGSDTGEPREHYGTMLPDVESLHPTRGTASGMRRWASPGRRRRQSAEPAGLGERDSAALSLKDCVVPFGLFWTWRTSLSAGGGPGSQPPLAWGLDVVHNTAWETRFRNSPF